MTITVDGRKDFFKKLCVPLKRKCYRFSLWFEKLNLKGINNQ